MIASNAKTLPDGETVFLQSSDCNDRVSVMISDSGTESDAVEYDIAHIEGGVLTVHEDTPIAFTPALLRAIADLMDGYTDTVPETVEDAAERLWKAIDDKGIKGRLFREDCTYAANVVLNPDFKG